MEKYFENFEEFGYEFLNDLLFEIAFPGKLCQFGQNELETQFSIQNQKDGLFIFNKLQECILLFMRICVSDEAESSRMFLCGTCSGKHDSAASFAEARPNFFNLFKGINVLL